jgi:tRNA (pseudouridine54-N1)-methyltransferase
MVDNYLAKYHLKRFFILLSKQTKPIPSLSLNNLAGEARMDLLCRSITTALFLGGHNNSFRKETEIWIYFQSFGKVLIIRGSEIRGLNPDERSIAGLLKKVFSGQDTTGFVFKPANWLEIFKLFPNCYLLDKKGIYFSIDHLKEFVFVLGDHLGLTEEEKTLFRHNQKLALGNTVYLTSHCISIIHYLLDRYYEGVNP